MRPAARETYFAKILSNGSTIVHAHYQKESLQLLPLAVPDSLLVQNDEIDLIKLVLNRQFAVICYLSEL